MAVIKKYYDGITGNDKIPLAMRDATFIFTLPAILTSCHPKYLGVVDMVCIILFNSKHIDSFCELVTFGAECREPNWAKYVY